GAAVLVPPIEVSRAVVGRGRVFAVVDVARVVAVGIAANRDRGAGGDGREPGGPCGCLGIRNPHHHLAATAIRPGVIWDRDEVLFGLLDLASLIDLESDGAR